MYIKGCFLILIFRATLLLPRLLPLLAPLLLLLPLLVKTGIWLLEGCA